MNMQKEAKKNAFMFFSASYYTPSRIGSHS